MASAGRIVFIAGGCGFVGSGVTRAFLKDGAKVIVTSRSAERLENIWKNTEEKYRNELLTVQGDLRTEEGVNAIRDGVLADHGKIDDVISSLGSWWEGGSLTEQTLETFNKEIHNLAGTHFLVSKAFLPYLAETQGSTYTFVTGQTGERCFDKKTSLGTIGGACLLGVAEAARSEFYKTNVAVNEARLGVFIMPQADSVFGFHRTRVGNDFMGEVIAAITKSRSHEMFRISSRDDMTRIIRKYNVNIKHYKQQGQWVE